MAQTVIGRWETDGHLDAPYLTTLSPDALPALDKLPPDKRDCIAGKITRAVQSDPWYAFNSARAAARKIKLDYTMECHIYLGGGYRLEGNWVDPGQP